MDLQQKREKDEEADLYIDSDASTLSTRLNGDSKRI